MNPVVQTYLNRLSDWLFALARAENATAGVPDSQLVDAQRVAAYQQTVWLDENRVCFKARAFFRVNLIFRETIAILVEMQKSVVKGHPNLAAGRIDAESGEDGVK